MKHTTLLFLLLCLGLVASCGGDESSAPGNPLASTGIGGPQGTLAGGTDPNSGAINGVANDDSAGDDSADDDSKH